jgi:hypothetical protein
MNNVPMDTAARIDSTRPRRDDSVRSEGTRWYNIVLNYSLVLSIVDVTYTNYGIRDMSESETLACDLRRR